jgi:hypothetical protein
MVFGTKILLDFVSPALARSHASDASGALEALCSWGFARFPEIFRATATAVEEATCKVKSP